ncbi:MAG: hypothetical protein KF832_00600 [Caldilineaceae bacterium]|nr:hypothetical protein [Caldilineaceae bacterium]
MRMQEETSAHCIAALLDQEELRIVALDRKNKLVDRETICQGSVNNALSIR